MVGRDYFDAAYEYDCKLQTVIVLKQPALIIQRDENVSYLEEVKLGEAWGNSQVLAKIIHRVTEARKGLQAASAPSASAQLARTCTKFPSSLRLLTQ